MRKSRTIKKNIIASPAELAQKASNGRWKATPHLNFIDRIIVETITSKDKHLIVNMPPRHGKSELISVWLPVWFLGINPDKHIILTTYGQSLSNSFGRKVRDIVKEHGVNLFGIEIDQSHKSASNFGINNHLGGFIATGVGGPITGKGADLFIIDDPIKNQLDAHSQNARDRLWEWFKSTAYTRLEPGGIFIIAMTRWHEDDLCGRIIKHSKIIIPDSVDSQNSLIINSTTSNSLLSDIPDNELVSYNSDNEVNEDELDAINGKDDEWILIRLPALAIDGDVLCRKLDEPLWEERYNRKKILRQRNTLGSYWFSAMYQQAPVPADSLIFKQKHFKYFEEGSQYYTLFDELEKRNISKNALSLFATADLAVKASQTADYTVIIVYAVSKKNDILILDVIREKFNATDHIRLLERIRERWHPLLIGIEGTQYQLQLIQTAIQQGFYIKELKSQGDKVTRSLPIAALMENGKVYFKLNSHWLPTFENELLSFPTGRYDDQVDAFSYITQMLIPFSGVKPVSAKKRSSVNDMSFEGF